MPQQHRAAVAGLTAAACALGAAQLSWYGARTWLKAPTPHLRWCIGSSAAVALANGMSVLLSDEASAFLSARICVQISLTLLAQPPVLRLLPTNSSPLPLPVGVSLPSASAVLFSAVWARREGGDDPSCRRHSPPCCTATREDSPFHISAIRMRLSLCS